MKGYFTKKGKYGSAAKTSVVVTDKDVKENKIFDIDEFYARYFIEAGVFVAGNVKPKPAPKPKDFKEGDKK